MSTLDTLQTLLVHDLRDLSRLEKRRPFVLPMTRLTKEQHIGRACYLAEEFLSAVDLLMLKHQVGLDERQWRAYKWTFLHTAPAY